MTTSSTKEQAYIGILGTGVDFDRRTLYLIGEIGPESFYRFYHALKMIDETEGDIKVIINSVGGEETSGYALYDAMMTAKNKIVTEGHGQVSSIAAIIFQAGDERLMAPGCEYMIHNGSIGMDDEIKQDHIMELADSIRRGNKRYHTILVENSSYSLEEIQELCKEEKSFSSKEVLEAGLADALIAHVKKKRKVTKKKRKKK